MVKVYYNEVTDNLGDKTIAIIGYGSQGHAHDLPCFQFLKLYNKQML